MCALGIVACGSLHAQQPSADPIREIKVVTTLKDVDGSPVEGVGILMACNTELKHAITSVQGISISTLTVHDSDKAIEIRVGIARDESEWTPSPKAAARFKEALDRRCVPEPLIIPLSPTSSEINAAIVLKPAVHLTGRLVGRPIQVDSDVVFAVDNHCPIVIDPKTSQVLSNNWPLQQSGGIAVCGPFGGISFVPITKEQASHDIDLGAVQLSTGCIGLPVTITHSHYESWDVPRFERVVTKDITFLRPDGTPVQEASPIQGQAWIAGTGGPDVKPLSLPAGDYFVVPGAIHSWTLEAVRASIRESGDKAARAAKLPLITVKEGGPNTFTIDIKQMFAACRTLRGTPQR